MSPSNNPRSSPILCYVTDRLGLPVAPSNPQASVSSLPSPHEPLLRTIEAASQAGVDWIQLREKDLSAKECVSLTRSAHLRAQKPSRTQNQPSRILINDRLDVALAGHAGGVHLGENSLPVEEVKRFLQHSSPQNARSKDFLVGVSCHSMESAISAANAGADYIFFGPVFATPSKAAYGAPQGLERLAAICQSISIPVLAIGGITLENITRCLTAGAAGIAAIRMFQDAADIAAIVRRLRA
jgi:thiamine-phosphate pyrophosphorylase